MLIGTEAMKLPVIAIRSVMAASLLTIGVTVGGFSSAAAQPVDYGALPVSPNEVTDSTAYSAAAPVLSPDGQPGVSVVYTHRDGARSVTNTILVLADAQAATAAMDQSRAEMVGPIVDSTTQPAAVGTGGTVVSGLSPDRTTSISALTFTQGNAFTTIEFEGPPNDPVPLDLVTEYGERQDTAMRNALSP
jgi:hypothetical protein